MLIAISRYFTEEQIEDCIVQNIPDKTKAVELVQMLKERQDITSLCYIPLNCAIVLYVYKMEQCTLPNTLTKLYEIFILNSIKRHGSITGNDLITVGLHMLAEIPESFQKHLNALGKLAYDGLVEDKMVFSVKDIKAAFPNCSYLDISNNLLSLMTVFKEFTSTGEELSYQFLHLTIQEFLAARWAASELSDCELLKFFQDNLCEEQYRMVLLFLAGILQLEFSSAEDLFKAELDLKHPKSRECSNRKVVDYFLFLAHLIYESQTFSLFHNLAGTIVGAELFAAWYHMSPFDCLVLAHFLAWCDSSLKLLNLHGCGLTNQFLETMQKVNVQHHGTTQIEEVYLSNNPMVLTTLSLLPKLPVFAHTSLLIAYSQYPEGISYDQINLHHLLNMKHLTTLEVSTKERNAGEIKCFLSLEKFQLQNGNILSQNAVDIFRSLEHNTSLEELDLSQNSQLAEDDSEAVGCAIERMLNVNRTLKVLNLSDCQVTDPIVKHILTGLMKNTSLVTLNMRSPKLSSSCAVSLFQQMTTHHTLSRVHVDEVNVLGVGRVKMDRGSVWCVIGDMIPENCVEFFRGLNNSDVNISNLNVEDLTDLTAEHFAVGLAESQSVQALKLIHGFGGNKNNIGSTGAVSIFRSLEHNTSLEELDLSWNRQLAEGDSEAVGCAIERMLNVNRTLKVLNLHGCKITDPIVNHILTGLTKNTSPVTLDMGSLKLSGSCVVSLFQQMTTHPILSITVDEVDVLGVGWVKIGRGNLWCVMSDTVLGDLIPENCVEFFRALNNSGLKVSKLNVQYLTYQIAKRLAMPLAKRQLFKALSFSPTMEVERVEMDRVSLWCVLGDMIPENCVFFRALNNSGLKVSNLNVQHLTYQAAEHFAVELAESQSVQTLKLEHCNISSTGSVSIFRSLEHNTSLEELDLSGNWLLAGGDSEAVGCAIEKMLNVNKTLKVLNLNDCRLDTTVITHTAAGLAHNASLVELNIGRNSFSKNTITSEGWVHLFKALCNNTSLKKLDISHNDLGMEVSVPLAEMLSCNKSLTELNLGCCDLPEAGLREIARGLLHNISLKKLDISGNKPGMEGSVALAEMLSCNKSLTELNLGWCDIPEAGLREIARGLLQNNSLKKLDISGNKLGMEGSVALAEMLSSNQSLTELNLRGCDIPEGGLREIARGLLQNTSLKKLDISDNNLGMEGSVALAEMLSCNKSLTELNLGWCDIPEAGLREIARGLLQNNSLKKLDISGNKLGMEGSVALAEMLSSNQSLTELNLWSCDIPEAGLREIARGLLQNTSLKKLDISGNKLGMEGSVALAEMLSCNKSLTELNLWGCDIPEGGLREIARGLLQNTSLQTLNLWPSQQKEFLEEEIERLKKSGNFTPQSSNRLEIKY